MEDMETPKFPEKAIIKILKEKTISRFTEIEKESFDFGHDCEIRQMKSFHLQCIDELETYEDINNWMCFYLRMSLQEWVDSLEE